MKHSPGRPHWRTLPQTLPAAYRDVVSDLRQLKDHSRLSLTDLGRTTNISKSSWERYLNAKQFPPRHAVQALCRAATVSDEAVLLRWERADAEWNRRGHTASPVEPKPDQTTAHRTDGSDHRESKTTRSFVHRALLSASALITARPWALRRESSSCARRCSHLPRSSAPPMEPARPPPARPSASYAPARAVTHSPQHAKIP
ncbi:helix-turn-helix domain-containing protein [Streptomyces griseoluteus]|uniref:helix-turn-helix domain-containing protein n=1 Tax=Streptomyces griseoluteus TaxID=29306 RepID=UPI0036784B53